MPGLLDPITLGELKLPNRILMAPLTRNRSSGEARVPNALMRDCYVQRASAGAILSEVTSVSALGHDLGDSNLAATFGHVARELGRRRIAFLYARESESGVRLRPALKDAFGGVYLANEGFTRASATRALAAGEADAVAFGKLFIANPDLPRRFARGAPLNPWNDATFYSQGAAGYTDYPALEAAAQACEV